MSGDEGGTDDSDAAEPDSDSESRFGKFVDRLDDREAERDAERGGDTERGDAGGAESDATPEEEAPGADAPSTADAEPMETDVPADRSTTGPDGGERIWDGTPGDSPEQSSPDDSSVDATEGEPGGGTADRGSAIDSGLDRAAVEPFSEGDVDSGEGRGADDVDQPADEPPDATADPADAPSDPASSTEVPDLSRSGPGEDLDRAAAAESALILGPTGNSISDTICSRFLTVDGESRDVIFVTFDQSPEDRIEICRGADRWVGGRIGVIEVGRGGRGSADSEITGGGGSITVRHVSKPGDLSKLGIVITQLLSAFDDSPATTVLCFHTLSALHREVGTKTLFRFISTLQGRLNSADAVGHYHMNPDLHDEIVVETIRPIFDSIVRFSATGDFEIE